MNFKRKVCLVTGGSRGIGRAIVEELSSFGVTVYFTYISHTDEINKMIQKSEENKVFPRLCDVSDYLAVKKLVQEIQTGNGKIDFVVNNAGISRDRSLAFMTLNDWNEVIQTNLNGTFNICKNVIVKMIKRRFGKIINIASISGINGNPGQCNYAASKAGIIGFTKSLAKEVADCGITVNVVAPGLIDTDMISKISLQERENKLKMIPLKRLGITNEISSMVTYLLSEKGDYITGEVIKIDGGAAI